MKIAATIAEYNPFDVKAAGLDKSSWEHAQAGFGLELYMRHNHALEGARRCMRECFAHLECLGCILSFSAVGCKGYGAAECFFYGSANLAE